MAKNFESIIRQTGGFGRFQLMMVCVVFGQKFFSAWSMLQMAVAGIKPDFHCITDAYYTAISRSNTSVLNYTDSLHRNDTTLLGSHTLNKCSVNGSRCVEYRFDTSIRSVINEWDLVCDLSWVKATTTSIQMAGVLVGAIVTGQLGDLYGRKHTCYGLYLAHSLVNVGVVFSNSWQMFMAFRFLIGFGIGAILVSCTPYPMEFVPEKHRSVVAVIPWWPLGVCFFAFMAYLMEDWVHLHLACAAISAPLMIGWFFTPESIRWLAVRGKTEETYRVFEKIASINGKPLPDDTRKIIEIVADNEKAARENGQTYSYWDIFRGSETVKNTVAFGLMWCAFSLVSYGVSFGVSTLGGNTYLNLFLLYLSDIPVMFTTFYTSNKFGRRISCVFYILLGAASGFGSMASELAAPESFKSILITVMTLIAKSSVAAAWTVTQYWIVESYPTVIRNLGYGFTNMSARVGGIIAPFAINLDDRFVLSYILIGAFLVLSAGLALLIKETNGMALTDSITMHVSQPARGDTTKGGNSQNNAETLTEVTKGGNSQNNAETLTEVTKGGNSQNNGETLTEFTKGGNSQNNGEALTEVTKGGNSQNNGEAP